MSKPDFALDPRMRAVDATLVVLRTLAAAAADAEPGVRADTDVEALHEFRVALRRTRSALSQIKRVFPRGSIAPFKDGFRWMGRETGPQRDADVLLLDLPGYERTLRASGPIDFDPLRGALRERRRIALERTLAALGSSRYAALRSDWDAFLAAPHAAGPEARRADKPILRVASRRLRRVHAGVLGLGDALVEDSPAADFHALRIEVKKLRYLLTFFRSLFPAGDVAAVARALRRLQDALGVYNDCDVQSRLLGDLRVRAAASPPDDAGDARADDDAVGRLLHLLDARRADVRARFARIYAHVASDEQQRRFASAFDA